MIRLVCAAEVTPRRRLGWSASTRWAWRKRRSYGTAIVDLERNKVVDLLPDREEDSVARWLRDHPGIEVVARDRAEVYGEGARRGAPIHVADRWHLLKNLSTALQGEVGYHAALRQAARESAAQSAETQGSLRPTATEARRAARHAARDARYAELARLRDAGASTSEAARALGMDRKTVRFLLSAGSPPWWAKAGTMLDHEAAFLGRRWAEGCRRPAVLRRELAARGCHVGRGTVAYWIKTRLAGSTPPTMAAPPAVTWKPPTVVGMTRLLQGDSIGGDDGWRRPRAARLDLARAAELARRLATILRKTSAETLDCWLAEAASSPLRGSRGAWRGTGPRCRRPSTCPGLPARSRGRSTA